MHFVQPLKGSSYVHNNTHAPPTRVCLLSLQQKPTASFHCNKNPVPSFSTHSQSNLRFPSFSRCHSPSLSRLRASSFYKHHSPSLSTLYSLILAGSILPLSQLRSPSFSVAPFSLPVLVLICLNLSLNLSISVSSLSLPQHNRINGAC